MFARARKPPGAGEAAATRGRTRLVNDVGQCICPLRENAAGDKNGASAHGSTTCEHGAPRSCESVGAREREARVSIRRDRPFAAYLGTQASWFFAFGLQSVLVPFIAKRLLHASDAEFGVVQASLMAPIGFLILFGGVAAERLDRRHLLMGLHALAIVPPLALAYLAATDAWSINWLITYGLCMGSVAAVMMPTRDAALNAAAEASPHDITIQRAVVLASLVQFAAQIIGMGAATVAKHAERLALFANAAEASRLEASGLMVIQAILLGLGGLAALLLPRLPPPCCSTRPAGVGRQLAEGLSIVWNSPVIRPMALCMVGVGVFVIGMAFFVLLPLLVLNEFGGGLDQLGFALIVFWLGAATATAALTRLRHVERPGRPLVGALALGAASLAAFAFEPPFIVVVALVFFWGVSGGIGIAMSRSIVQQAAPPEALARVLSVYQLGFVAGAPAGMVAMGFIVEHLGAKTGAFVAMGGVLALAAWLALFTPIGRVRETGMGAA